MADSPKPYRGPAPYGFHWSKERLEADPVESPVRKLAFELFLTHKRKGTVARLLNEAGHKPRRGAAWRDVTVGRLLTCSSAIGDYQVNKTKTDADGKRIAAPESEWLRIECDALIPQNLWDGVQDILGNTDQSGKTKPASRKPIHTFSGLVTCSRCQERLIVPAGNSRKYICPTKGCSTKISIADLDSVFIEELGEFLTHRKDALQTLLFGGPETQLAHNLEEMKTLRKQISQTEQLFLNKKINQDQFGEMHSKLVQRLTDLGDHNSALKKEIDRNPSTEPNEDTVNVQDLIENWPNLPVESRQTIAHTLVDSISVGDAEIELSYRFQQTHQPNKPKESGLSLKDPTSSQQTENPTNQTSEIVPGEPIYIRLPPPKQQCSLTGLSRSKLNELILPSDRNSHNPPVESFSIKQPGQTKGTRLIVWESLKRFLEEQKK